jgi:hypothetical protein
MRRPPPSHPLWLAAALALAATAACKKDHAAPPTPAPVAPGPAGAVADDDSGAATAATADAGGAAASADDDFTAAPCWNGTAWVGRDAVGAPPGSAERCGSVGGKPLTETPLELLAGRLTVKGPQGSALLERTPSIMGAAESPEKETRVFYEDGDEKFVLMAWELFRSAGERLASQVRAEVELQFAGSEIPWCVERLPPAADGLRVFALVPTRLPAEGEALPVLSVLAAHPDGLAQLLRWYVNPALASDAAGCIALARRAAATLAAGPRRLPRTAEARRLDAFSQTKQLELQLPADYVHTTQPGPDFAVHRIEPIVPLGQTGASLGFYLGDNPAELAAGWGGSIDRSKAALLGEEVEWLAWFIPEDQGNPPEYHLEALRPLPDEMGFPHFLHVFITAGDAGLRDELRDVAKTLKIVEHSAR